MDVAADYIRVITGTSSIELDILNYARGESLNGNGEIYRRCEEGRAYYTLLSQIRAGREQTPIFHGNTYRSSFLDAKPCTANCDLIPSFLMRVSRGVLADLARCSKNFLASRIRLMWYSLQIFLISRINKTPSDKKLEEDRRRNHRIIVA
jgi:hypothetical protein